jgi:hypothetical protein
MTVKEEAKYALRITGELTIVHEIQSTSSSALSLCVPLDLATSLVTLGRPKIRTHMFRRRPSSTEVWLSIYAVLGYDLPSLTPKRTTRPYQLEADGGV